MDEVAVAKNVIDPDEGIYGSFLIPGWDPPTAVDEIERGGTESGILRVYTFISFHEPFGASKYDAIYDKSTTLNLPLLIPTSWPVNEA